MKTLFTFILLLVLPTWIAVAQPSPVFPASVQQTIDGIVGAPFYITPFDAAQAGFGTGGGGGISAAQLTAALLSGTNPMRLSNAVAGTLPRTAADGTWYQVSNYPAFDWTGSSTATNAGFFMVLNGFDANGSPRFKGTNPPTGGTSFPLSADADFNQHAGTNISSTTYQITAGPNHLQYIWAPDFGTYQVAVMKLIASGDLAGNGIASRFYIADGGLGTGPFQGFIATNAGVSSSFQSNFLNTGTGTFNAGSVSLIPTNAAVVSTVVGVAPSMPFGITNSLAGRAQPVVQYFIIDSATGVPILTVSNEATGVKLTKGKSQVASGETNWFTLPITSTNTIWRARDESTGSGASVGILTNWFIGL